MKFPKPDPAVKVAPVVPLTTPKTPRTVSLACDVVPVSPPTKDVADSLEAAAIWSTDTDEPEY